MGRAVLGEDLGLSAAVLRNVRNRISYVIDESRFRGFPGRRERQDAARAGRADTGNGQALPLAPGQVARESDGLRAARSMTVCRPPQSAR